MRAVAIKAVAFSGGVDSTALLLRARRDAAGHSLVALHVNHGLQAAAESFGTHCRTVCEQLGVPLYELKVRVEPQPGDSLEELARDARYRALAQGAREQGAQAVLLGHHADDQAETLLLALSRGAGMPGLAAMPSAFERHGMAFERPLLALARSQLEAEVRAAGIHWIEDPTNTDLDHTRNRIRHQLLPAVEAAFPQFRQTFARSARHAAQAKRLLSELGEMDWGSSVGAADAGTLARLQRLSPERLGNALRHWLKCDHGVAPSEAQLNELCRQVQAATTRGHRIELQIAGGTVQRGPTADGPSLRFGVAKGLTDSPKI